MVYFTLPYQISRQSVDKRKSCGTLKVYMLVVIYHLVTMLASNVSEPFIFLIRSKKNKTRTDNFTIIPNFKNNPLINKEFIGF